MYSILNDRCSDFCSFYMRIFLRLQVRFPFYASSVGTRFMKIGILKNMLIQLIRLFCQLCKLELLLLKWTVRESTIVFLHFFVLSRQLKLCRADMHNRSRHNLMSYLDTQILLVTSSNLKVSSEPPGTCVFVFVWKIVQEYFCALDFSTKDISS